MNTEKSAKSWNLWSTMRSKKGALILLMLGGLLAIGLSACNDRGSRADRALDFMASRLDFDTEQIAIVDKLKLEIADIQNDARQDRIKRFEAAIEILNAESLEVGELEQMVDSQGQRLQATLPQILPLISELHGTLNTEQKAKLEKRMQRWQKKVERYSAKANGTNT